MDDKQLLLDGLKTLNIEMSPEQEARIEKYAFLLEKWQKKFNLISPTTIPYIYSRHILDCAQIAPYIKEGDLVLDIGSGAGLPSVVLAILTDAKVHACERNWKKVQFLNNVRRELELTDKFSVLQNDIYKSEDFESQYSVITSRAFSELKNIIDAGNPLLARGGKYILLKGGRLDEEINSANLKNVVTTDIIKSITFTDGKILIANTSST